MVKKQTEQQQTKRDQSKKVETAKDESRGEEIQDQEVLAPLSPECPDVLKPAVVKLENLPLSSCGMLDRTRVALLAFMFTFLFVSPLSYVMPGFHAGMAISFEKTAAPLSTVLLLYYFDFSGTSNVYQAALY